MNERLDQAEKPRILIVDDEPFIVMLLADMLEELGYSVTATFSNVTETLQYLATSDVGLALLDVNLGIEKVDPVADLLAGRQCPFIFTTGYGRAGVPEKYDDKPVLQKPFQINQLAETIKRELEILGHDSKM